MITAAVVSILFKLLKQPVVLGYIVAGVLVSSQWCWVISLQVSWWVLICLARAL